MITTEPVSAIPTSFHNMEDKFSFTPNSFEPSHYSSFSQSPSIDADTESVTSWASTPRGEHHLTPSSSFTSPNGIDFRNLDASPTLSERSKKFDALSIDVINTASDAVGHLLAHVLTMLEEPPFPRLPFDASCEPKINIVEYYQRIRQYSQATPESILCSLVVMRKVIRVSPHMYLTNYNIHRLIVTSIMVFAKFYDDEVDSNARWARIAGIKVHEVNNLEVEFLNRCQFDLRVTTQEFHDMVLELMAFTRRAHCMEQCAHYHHEGAKGGHGGHKGGIKMFHIKPKSRTLLNRNLCSHSEIDTTEFVQPTLIPSHHHPNSSHNHCSSAATDAKGRSVVAFFQPIPQFPSNNGTAQTPDPCSQRSYVCSPGDISRFTSPGACASSLTSPGGVCADHHDHHLAQPVASVTPDHKPGRLIRPYSMQSLASLLHKSPAGFFRHNSKNRFRGQEPTDMPHSSQESMCSMDSHRE